MINQNIPPSVQLLQQPDTHPKFHKQELYAATIYNLLARIQVQLEGLP